MSFTFIIVLIVSLCMPAAALDRESRGVLNSVSNLVATLDGDMEVLRRGLPFDLTATIVFPPIRPHDSIIVRDGTGTGCIKDRSLHHPPLRIGDVIRANGNTGVENKTAVAKCLKLAVVSHTRPSPPATVGFQEFLSGMHDRNVVRVVGVVDDVFRDEIDSDWTFLLLRCGTDTIYAASPSPDINSGDMQPLIGAEVAITGLCAINDNGLRRQIGRLLLIGGRRDIEMLRKPEADPFAAPELGDRRFSHPLDVPMQTRHRASGLVLASWGGQSLLIRRANGMVMRVELADGPPPQYGMTVEVIGFPETDLYRINLTRAVWRPLETDGVTMSNDVPLEICSRDIIARGPERAVVKSELHGQTIRIKGNVRSLPTTGEDGRIYIEDGSVLVPIDASSQRNATEDIEIGCQIEATGTCVMELDNWRPNSAFPQIKGFMVVVRTPEDIRILSRPPWWTTGRLLAVICALFGLLAAIFVWNRMLNRRAERRGRELAEEKVAHVTSDLKVYERTRLAVELHDSLSQNLTGVSLAIRAANRLADSNPDGMRRSLDLAAKTLDSCREELRNCLWDLRNQTLEENDMNEAIHQTLAPHIDGAKLSIRFNVPRERLSDNTTHSILHIIRELASNAIRHGNATEIRIAGAIENGRLLFSVSDNGSGFNPENRPTATDGHFGLQGIQDRVDGLEGDMTIQSTPGKGTKVSISIKATAPPNKSATSTRLNPEPETRNTQCQR